MLTHRGIRSCLLVGFLCSCSSFSATIVRLEGDAGAVYVSLLIGSSIGLTPFGVVSFFRESASSIHDESNQLEWLAQRPVMPPIIA